MDFKVTEYEKFIDIVSDSTFNLQKQVEGGNRDESTWIHQYQSDGMKTSLLQWVHSYVLFRRKERRV